MDLNTECSQTDGQKEKSITIYLAVHSVYLADITMSTKYTLSINVAANIIQQNVGIDALCKTASATRGTLNFPTNKVSYQHNLAGKPGTRNPATGIPSYRGHCNQVTETGKAIRECGATWRIRLNIQTTSGLKYDVYMKFHGDLICFDVMISTLLQDYGTMT